jgi:hypothetical protein
MPYRTRFPPVHTSALCVHMPDGLRAVVERYADKNRLSLGEAARELLNAGIEARGLA